jgi:hypothetical protein
MIVAPPGRALSSPQQRPVFTGLAVGLLLIGWVTSTRKSINPCRIREIARTPAMESFAALEETPLFVKKTQIIRTERWC